MIVGFGDSTTRDIFHGTASRAARVIPRDVWPIARRKLDSLNAATAVQDMRVPPGNRLEALKGNLKGFFSIRVNDQWRIIFRFHDAQADAVRIVDYH